MQLDESTLFTDTGGIPNCIARGGSGSVHVWKDAAGNAFILKLYSLESNDGMLGGIRALYQHSHPSIVNFYGVQSFPQRQYIVVGTELMNLRSLSDILPLVGTIPELVCRNIAAQVMSALSYLHFHRNPRIIHRNICLNKILLNSNGQFKVGDFGRVGILENTLGVRETWIGSELCMSPERLLGEPHHSNCDVWSLGVVLYICTMAQHPAQPPPGEESNILEITNAIVEGPPPTLPPPPQLVVSDNFRDFVKNCCQKDPARRPFSKDMLEHPFVLEANPNDTLSWLQSVNIPAISI